ncbi:LysR family transcriptional regulator [Paenibacillaceae bacterium]|nr:LysR family transcriptional regulator [Paenibacillaceae bacterium]
MNIENIEAFVYVIHYGNFNKAAEALYVTQPSVTSRIQSLERELDCQLFIRNGKKIVITDKGKHFLPYAQHLLQTYQKAKLKLQEKKALPNEIRIGCTLSASNYMIPKVIMEVRRRYPELQFRVITASTEEILKKLLNKEIDFGFVRRITHPNIHSVKIHEDPIRLFGYEGHPFVGREDIPLEELGKQSLVFFECGSLDWMRIHRMFESLDSPPRLEYQVDNMETAKKLVLDGAGICFLPTLYVETEVNAKKLYPIRIASLPNVYLQTHMISLNEGYNSIFEELSEISKGIH